MREYEEYGGPIGPAPAGGRGTGTGSPRLDPEIGRGCDPGGRPIGSVHVGRTFSPDAVRPDARQKV